MINSQGQITDTDFSPDTLSVTNVLPSAKDETTQNVMNFPEEGKSDGCRIFLKRVSQMVVRHWK